MKTLVAVTLLLSVLAGGCGVRYSIPASDSDEIGTIVSSGRSPQSCIENLHEDAKDLKVKVKLTDVKHEEASGPIAWIYAYSYTCTGKVVARG